MEIERKFLIHNKSRIEKIKKEYSKKEIIQDYLYLDTYTAVRKRKIVNASDIQYIYTVKTMKEGFSVNEFEKEITEHVYQSLQLNQSYYTIIKDRYIVPYVDNLKIELDVFHGIYEGIVFAEIEFESEEQASKIKLPEWFGQDISKSITNSQMAIKNIKEEIENINRK